MAEITTYTDIITLARAKNYLRIDDTGLPALEDQEITSMIKASFLFIERYTNHLFGARELTQYVPPKIYNYPINSILGVQEEDLSHYYQRNMDKYCEDNLYKTPVPVLTTYNAGYINVEDVPEDFIQAALQIIKVWYFEAQNQVNETLIPVSVRQVLDQYRRFV